MKAVKRYKITTTVQGCARSQVWDAAHPKQISPLWIIEKKEDHLRVRQVARARGQMESTRVFRIPLDGNTQSIQLELNGPQSASAITLGISETSELDAFYRQVTESADSRRYFLAHLRRGQILNCVPLNPGVAHAESFDQKAAFEVNWNGASPLVKRADSGEIEKNSDSEFTRIGVTGAMDHEWILGWAHCSDQLAAEISFRATLSAEEQADRREFRRSEKISGTVLAVCLGLFFLQTFLTKNPENQPEIPPQFAKIILSPALKKPAQPSASAGSQEAAANPNLPKKVRDAAVVKAFRAETLQKSLKGLLKGGMTTLLAKSNFTAGLVSTAQAKRLFDSKHEALKPTGTEVGMMNANQVQVAALGGGGLNGSGLGKGTAGYGKGENAQVNGQGSAFVSAELKDSVVEEGLTKDQVGEVIHKHMSEIRYCYESAMIKRPDLEGKLMIAFVINGSGAVKSSQIQSSTLPDPGLDQCVITRLGRWKFPQPRGGVDVAVTYPFIFKTLGR